MEIQPQEKPKVPAKEEKKPTTEKEQMAFGVREYAKAIKSISDPNTIVDQIAEEICKLPDGPERMPAIRKMIMDKGDELVMSEGIGTQFALSAITPKIYQPLIVAFARQLIEEYKCDGPSEKAIAEVAAGAYIRILEYSELFIHMRKNSELSHEKNGFYSIVSKELDRAHRQFESALSTLKQMKVPALAFTVNSKNTFIADKQQFNNVKKQ